MQTKHFEDFDAFAESIPGIESKMLLRNPKRRAWSLSLVDLQGVHLQLGRLGSGNIAAGALRSDGYLLYLPLSPKREYSANGIVLPAASFAILEPGCEFCVSTKFEHDWCAVTIPTDIFAAGRDVGEPSAGSDKSTVRVTRANRSLVNQFRAVVGQIMAAAAHCPQLESASAAKYATAELLKVASLVVGQRQPGEPHREGRPRIPRVEIIRRTRELLKQRDGERVLIADLAIAADVSERTLRTAFNEYFGIGPVRYLQLKQLHRIHRELRAADPEAITVSEVLVRHGEWEFSRFASRYRRQFGELPSETLRGKTP